MSDTDEIDHGAPRILRGNPTAEEIAAVSAVLAALVEAGLTADRPRDVPRPASAWTRSQRFLQGGGSASDPFGGRFGR